MYFLNHAFLAFQVFPKVFTLYPICDLQPGRTQSMVYTLIPCSTKGDLLNVCGWGKNTNGQEVDLVEGRSICICMSQGENGDSQTEVRNGLKPGDYYRSV